jgi:DnaJ-class molecular chaperone
MYTEVLMPERKRQLKLFRSELFALFEKYNFSIGGGGDFIIECNIPGNITQLDSAIKAALNVTPNAAREATHFKQKADCAAVRSHYFSLNRVCCPACKGKGWQFVGYTVKGKGYGQQDCLKCDGEGLIMP